MGRKGAAIDLYRKRRTEASEERKVPDRIRARKAAFEELAKDALQYSKAHKLSYVDDQMAKLTGWRGQRPAESVSPQEIERWLLGKAEELKPATLNRYRALLSLTYRLEACRMAKCNPTLLAWFVSERRKIMAGFASSRRMKSRRLERSSSKTAPRHIPLERCGHRGFENG